MSAEANNTGFNTAMDDLLAVLSESLTAAKEAAEQNDLLRKKVAEQEKIILEKVAAVKTASSIHASPEKISDLVVTLVSNGLFDKNGSEQLAKKLAEHPDNIIKLASGLASLSAPAAQQGRGISKNASSEAPTPISDEWETVIREGA
jgi:hypothetical protein